MEKQSFINREPTHTGPSLAKGTPVAGGSGGFNQMCPNCESVFRFGSLQWYTIWICSECGEVFSSNGNPVVLNPQRMSDGGIFFRYHEQGTK